MKTARLFDSAVVPPIWPLMRFGSEKRLLLSIKNLLMAPEGPRWGCDVGCTCNRGTSACSGLGCHTLSTPTACLLSPFVAGGGAPSHASCALQYLDDKALSARPAGWHGLCSLRERRPHEEPGGGRQGGVFPVIRLRQRTGLRRDGHALREL